VLVADDEEDLLTLVSMQLEEAGCDVITAMDGRRAYELAAERQPDLAVLDVRMPLVFGYEVTRRIRNNDEIAGMPVILLTASADSGAMLRGTEAGADYYITKPFKPQDLIARVQELLDRGPARDTTPVRRPPDR
jgi:two-component system alkaline phosphatase synthesis response regulator PhoP